MPRDAPIPKTGAERRAYTRNRAFGEAMQHVSVMAPLGVGVALAIFLKLGGFTAFAPFLLMVAALSTGVIAAGYQWIIRTPVLAHQFERELEDQEKEERIEVGRELVRLCRAKNLRDIADKLEGVVETYGKARQFIRKSSEESAAFEHMTQMAKLEQSYNSALTIARKAIGQQGVLQETDVPKAKSEVRRLEGELAKQKDDAGRDRVGKLLKANQDIVDRHSLMESTIQQCGSDLDAIEAVMQIAHLTSAETVNAAHEAMLEGERATDDFSFEQTSSLTTETETDTETSGKARNREKA